jgi:AraC-like DNA-binding protein
VRARFEKIAIPASRSFHIAERRLLKFDAPWHFHPELELTYIAESRGRRFVGDSIEPYAEGDLVLLGPNLPHFWHTEGRRSPKARAHSIYVQFRQDFLGPELLSRPEFAAVRQLFQRSARGLVFPRRIVRQVAPGLHQLVKMTGLPAVLKLLEILNVLAHARAPRPLASAAYEPSLDARAEDRLARVYDFLTKNFREQLTLRQIARAASMTPEAFSRYFKKAAGRNVSVFINELRIDHAARLLRETTARIGDIAAQAGFVTLSSFNRRFRERMHVSPRIFRKAYVHEGALAPAFQQV